VGRLLGPAGIKVEAGLALPERLRTLQDLMAAGDERAARVYDTVGTYLGYALLDYRDFYDFDNVLVLGRVVSGIGGDLILAGAQRVLASDDAMDPTLPGRSLVPITFLTVSERDKRHGQAAAAASLPALQR
jgi:predicted NBD/HSP70 family sugar kinase